MEWTQTHPFHPRWCRCVLFTDMGGRQNSVMACRCIPNRGFLSCTDQGATTGRGFCRLWTGDISKLDSFRSPLGGYQHRKTTSNVGFNRLVNVDGGHRGERDLTEFISRSSCVTKELTDVIAGVERLIVVAVVIFGLVLLAIVGVEPSRRFEFTKRLFESSRSGETGRNFSGLSLGQAWRILRASPQVGYFFGVLSLFTFALFLQEAVLEPYGCCLWYGCLRQYPTKRHLGYRHPCRVARSWFSVRHRPRRPWWADYCAVFVMG